MSVRSAAVEVPLFDRSAYNIAAARRHDALPPNGAVISAIRGAKHVANLKY